MPSFIIEGSGVVQLWCDHVDPNQSEWVTEDFTRFTLSVLSTDYDYQFTMSIKLASKSLLEALEIDILPTLTQHPDVSINSEEISQLAFEGGKIIFTKKGKEINPFENTKQ